MASELYPLETVLRERIVVLDGAMGTMIQRYKLSEQDYRGERFRDWKGKDLKGSLELLQLTQAQVIEEIHTKYLEAGADIIMIESEGITENVDTWRTDVPAKFINEIGMDKLMFEAADPDVFAWYIKNFGADVNLFVDHSQIVQLECLRAGIWGTKSLWGRVVTYKE